MKHTKAVFFDMGNTLLHFHTGELDEEKNHKGLLYLTSYLSRFSSQITMREVEKLFFKEWMNGIKDRKVTLKEYPIEAFLNRFLETYHIHLGLSECIEAIHCFYTEYREHVSYEKNIQLTLKAIKEMGYKIGVISNTCYYDEVMEACFEKAGIHTFIDCFTFSYSLQSGKPDKKIFQTALRKMKVIPQESIMVGDNLNSDIRPAKELGMRTAWLHQDKERGSETVLSDAAIPDIIIPRLSELPQYLRKEHSSKEKKK